MSINIFPKYRYGEGENGCGYAPMFQDYSDTCTFIDFDDVRIAAHPEFARALWKALDRVYGNEGNTKEYAQACEAFDAATLGALLEMRRFSRESIRTQRRHAIRPGPQTATRQSTLKKASPSNNV